MNYQKYVTAILYAVQVPFYVWAGFEFGTGEFVNGVLLTALVMFLDMIAVITWMNAQTLEINKTKRTGGSSAKRKRTK